LSECEDKIVFKSNLKEHSANQERSRKILEQQLAQAQARLEQAESSGVKDSKRVIQSLEQRVSRLCGL